MKFYPELIADRCGGLRLLACIREVEHPVNPFQPGRFGELGPYQFRRDTWEHLTRLPFSPQYACDEVVALSVAVLHYHEICEALSHSDIQPTPALIAAAWNAGCHAVLTTNIPTSTQHYVARVTNLYYTDAR